MFPNIDGTERDRPARFELPDFYDAASIKLPNLPRPRKCFIGIRPGSQMHHSPIVAAREQAESCKSSNHPLFGTSEPFQVAAGA